MSSLWSITCFFNPAGYHSRLRNYRLFRQRLATPLITVELSFDGRFALNSSDADILVQLDQGDILFQKERLLNIALLHAPAECRGIAWIDCDVIFASDDWPDRTLQALEQFPILQTFSERFDLPPGLGPDQISAWTRPADRISLMSMVHRDAMTAADFEKPKPFQTRPAWGLAWAARKDLLDAHGLYDTCVLNGGDGAILSAALGIMETPFMRRRMNEPSYRHYLEWARPFASAVGGKVGFIDEKLFHLWHGSLANRRYSAYLGELGELGFDPATDIAKTEQGAWKWSSEKPQLHAHVRQSFWSRDEDAGQPGESVSAA